MKRVKKQEGCCLLPCLYVCFGTRRRFLYSGACIWSMLSLLLIFYSLDTPIDYRTSHSTQQRLYTEYANCSSKHNVAFVKVHKCASSTIANMIVRRGLYVDRAVFGLPKQDPAHIGWPRSLTPKHVLRPNNQPVNIITHHFVYNRTTLKALMPSDTVYLAIVREPYSQFQSTMHYFRELTQLGLKSYDHAHEFLNSPTKFEKKVRMLINVWPPAYHSLTRNFMSSEFGLDEKDMKDQHKIEKFVENIDHEFDLVLIYEYFYESVVLMRRLLCWRLRDVLFRTVNFKFEYNKSGYDTDKMLYRRWSLADHLLYARLNATFWRKVEAQSDDFQNEVEHLKQVNQIIRIYCRQQEKDQKIVENDKYPVFIASSPWNDQFSVTSEDCKVMRMRPDNFYHKLLRSNYNTPQMLWIYFYHHFLKFL